MPALDGIRGAALIAVLFFHSRFGWAKGGFLGVTTFFVLSGFLITGLLLRERETSGTIRLRHFWERRARRLAPAIVVLLGLVTAYVYLGALRPPRGVVGDAIASSTWVANWRFVFAGHSYADLFTTASPFQHMWSLAVEEQVYLLLPLFVLALLGWRRDAPHRARLGVGLVVVAAASTVTMALLHTPGHAPLHEYYGTDARAAEPVVGALLALLLIRADGLRHLGAFARGALDVAGVGAFGGLLWFCEHFGQRADALYRGGFLLAAVLSAVVIAAATQPGGVVAWAFSFEPLAGLGKISYGAYLFHWPIFLWVTTSRTGLAAPRLFVVRCMLTVALAMASYFLIEAPIRAGRLSLRIGIPSWANASVGIVAVLTLITMESSAGATTALSGPLNSPAPPPMVAAGRSGRAGNAPHVVLSATAPPAAGAPGAPTTPHTATPNEITRGPAPADAPPAWDGTGTRPLRVAIIGDSMANNLAGGLKAWADERGGVITYGLATLGCPLSRGGTRRSPTGDDWPVYQQCGWWADPSSQRSQYLAEFHPDVIVVQDAMNELPDRKLPEWSDYRHTGQPAFDQWLLSEYQALIATVAPKQGNVKVLFLNAVCVDWELLGGGYEYYQDNGEGDRRVQSLRATANALASTGARIEDYFTQLCPNGQFTQNVDGVSQARPDGYHLSDAAAKAVAEQWLGPQILDAANGVLPAK